MKRRSKWKVGDKIFNGHMHGTIVRLVGFDVRGGMPHYVVLWENGVKGSTGQVTASQWRAV